MKVWNGPERHTHTLLHCCAVNLLYSRCFSFGIGEGASTALINGMAKEGRGHAQFITGAERMQPKVGLQGAPTLTKQRALLDRRFSFSSGDAVAALRPAAHCEKHLSQVGFAQDGHGHTPLSANHSHLPGPEGTGVLSAQWEGGDRDSPSESPSKHFRPSISHFSKCCH